MDPEQLYETLSNILADIRSLSEIAVSPYTLPHPPPPTTTDPCATIHPFTLFEPDKLVIPQKPLYAAYRVAARKLASHDRQETLTRLAQIEFAAQDDLVDSLDRITRVVVLQVPEHLRALNLRKRILLARIRKESGHGHEMVQTELHYTKLVLGIASNAKMATLWHHRKWLLSLLHTSLSFPSPSQQIFNLPPLHDLADHALQEELALVERCAERYPRNYMAWAYRGWLVEGIVSNSIGEEEAGISSEVQGQEVTRLLRHITLHITDHTAVVHLLRVLSKGEGQTDLLRKRVQEHALDIVARFSSKETPWLFLRDLILANGIPSQGELGEQAMTLARAIENSSGKNASGDDGAQDWAVKERDKAARYARRTAFFLHGMDGTGPSLGSQEAQEVLSVV